MIMIEVILRKSLREREKCHPRYPKQPALCMKDLACAILLYCIVLSTLLL